MPWSSRWLDIFLGLVNYMYFAVTSKRLVKSYTGTISDIVRTALYVYDYLLTLDREIKYFWKAQQSFGTILFYFYRYPALANTIFEVLSRMSASWQTARVSQVIDLVLRFY